MKRTARLLVAVAIAAIGIFGATITAEAMECVGIQGVLRYCPGRTCITEPCLGIQKP